MLPKNKLRLLWAGCNLVLLFGLPWLFVWLRPSALDQEARFYVFVVYVAVGLIAINAIALVTWRVLPHRRHGLKTHG